MPEQQGAEGPDDLKNKLTGDMVGAFWRSKPRKFREKWTARLRHGLSPKRQHQLIRLMTEFFARQKGPMEEIAKAKRTEFQKQLDDTFKNIQRLEHELSQQRQNLEQLRGAVAAVDKIFAAAAGPQLALVPPLPPLPVAGESPETPTPEAG